MTSKGPSKRTECILSSNLQHGLENLDIYIFGLEFRASGLEDDIHGSTQNYDLCRSKLKPAIYNVNCSYY